MVITRESLTHLTDRELLTEARRLADGERRATARLIAALMELDARKLYLGEGCSSLFVYCTRVLRLSESAAYARIEAARTVRRFPVTLEMLVDASITLTTVVLLTPVLNGENHAEVLATAQHKSKREVQELVARLRPAPAVCSSVRKLPAAARPAPVVAPQTAPAASGYSRASDRPFPITAAPAVSHPPVVAPLAPDCYRIQITVGAETYARLRRVQDLMRHSIPNGDPAIIFDRALALLLTDLERKKLAVAKRPRISRVASRSRRIPAAVRRAVWARDGGRCAFVGTAGRCTETGFLEFHHVEPFAIGGEAIAENIQLRYAPHNRHEAAQYFGERQPWLLKESRGLYGSSTNSVQTEFMGQ